MVFHLFCNEEGLTELSFCVRKSAAGGLSMKGGGETGRMKSLASRVAKTLLKHNSLFRQIYDDF